MLPCFDCNGEGCEACNYTGTEQEVTGCPKQFAAGVGFALTVAELAEHGALPVAGGLLDQTAVGIEAIQAVWSAQAQAKAQVMRDG